MNSIHFILAVLIWTWILAVYATYNAIKSSEYVVESDHWSFKLLLLTFCFLAWPYPVIFSCYKAGKL